jgi:ferredoxin-type protein NapH
MSKQPEKPLEGARAKGAKMVRARRVTLTLVVVAVLASLAFDCGIGTPSSFGIGSFSLLCPLGGIEAMIASRSFIPVAAISAGVLLLFALVFGRAWCAWGCPAHSIRKFFNREPKPDKGTLLMSYSAGEKPGKAGGEAGGEATAVCESDGETIGESVSKSAVPISDASVAIDEAPGEKAAEAPATAGKSSVAAESAARSNPATLSALASPRAASATAFDLRASLRFIARDRRTWVFLAVLVAALIAGLPLFCLVCPIGLTFGTVGSLWHLIVDKQMTASVLVFPAALAIELVLYRKWCLNLCPIAGLLGIFSQFATRFRPQVNTQTCLRCTGSAVCEACTIACPEHIDRHAPDAAQQLGQCSRCGECLRACPTASIDIKVGEGKKS